MNMIPLYTQTERVEEQSPGYWGGEYRKVVPYSERLHSTLGRRCIFHSKDERGNRIDKNRIMGRSGATEMGTKKEGG